MGDEGLAYKNSPVQPTSLVSFSRTLEIQLMDEREVTSLSNLCFMLFLPAV